MKRAPVLVPATAPAGASRNKTKQRQPSSSGQTTPRDRSTPLVSTPDRTRKPSAATSSDEQSRRPSAWINRPSIMGTMAANRLGWGLVRRLRSSQSKRESTIGDIPLAPAQHFEPTFRLEPKVPFQPCKVQEVIKSTLDEHLANKSYRPKMATILCRMLSDELRDKVKGLGYERHRAVVTVLLGEKKDQGVMSSSRCAWDDKRDSYASYTFQAPDFFCTACVYGVYKE